jgi:hypothetical protein
MRLLATLVLTLFLSSVVTYAVAGREAEKRARLERDQLALRVETTRHALEDVIPVSHAELDALQRGRDALAKQGDQRVALITAARRGQQPLNLREALDDSDLASLATDSPLRSELLAWAAAQPGVEPVLAHILGRLDAAQIGELESLSARPEDALPPLPDLAAVALELVVVSEMPQVMDLLESLVPGRGEPILTVTGASLRRIDPALWSTTVPGLATPPVRLWVRVQAFTRAPPRSPGR